MSEYYSDEQFDRELGIIMTIVQNNLDLESLEEYMQRSNTDSLEEYLASVRERIDQAMHERQALDVSSLFSWSAQPEGNTFWYQVSIDQGNARRLLKEWRLENRSRISS
jgi:hypothetical protein